MSATVNAGPIPGPAWQIVAASAILSGLGFGTIYSIGIFAHSLEAEFSVGRGDTAAVLSLSGFLYFMLGLVSGPMADRWGARPVAALGVAAATTGLVAASFATSMAGVVWTYGLGLGFGLGLIYTPVLGAVQKWFEEKRGLASGLSAAGIGIGTLILPWTSGQLIAAMDWRSALLALAAGFATLGLVALLMLHPQPATPELAVAQQAAIHPRQAIRTRAFTGLYFAGLLGALGMFVPVVHFPGHARDLGVADAYAASLVALIGLCTLLGRIGFSAWADRFGRARAMAIMYLGMGVMLCLWSAVGSFWQLTAVAFLFGLFYGAVVALLPPVLADYFGSSHISTLIGIMLTATAIGTLIGPMGVGFLRDATGSYSIGALIVGIASIAAGFCCYPRGKP